eukprot:XP_011669413.1 PREDICTED: sorcin-like [Strongylocentrotus purpuratus]
MNTHLLYELELLCYYAFHDTAGYRLSPNAINALVRRYGVNGRIQFDAFVGCAVRLRALTDFFRRKDTQQNGNAMMQYDEFITSTMSM